MQISRGNEKYEITQPPSLQKKCKAEGRAWDSNDLNKAISGDVSKFLIDIDMLKSFYLVSSELVSSLRTTSFCLYNIKRHITSCKRRSKIPYWLVGEAIAHVYLMTYYRCDFPWPSSRDEKNSEASLTGADIVGFQRVGKNGFRFAFGEVKTSKSIEKHPDVKYELKKQLSDLQLNRKRIDLIFYIFCRSYFCNSCFKKYKKSFQNYATNGIKFSVFGFLIRDTIPNESDLKIIYENCLEFKNSKVNLIALYLPTGNVKNMNKLALKSSTGEIDYVNSLFNL